MYFTNRIVSSVALMALLATAQAAPPPIREWKQVTPPANTSLTNPALLRTSDGVLHIVTQTPAGKDNTGLADFTISPDGRISDKPVQILSGWETINNPALIETPDGRRMVLFGGTHTSNRNDPWFSRALIGAVSSDHGATWKFTPGDLSSDKRVYGADIKALVAQGKIYTAWGAVGGVIAWQSGFSATGAQKEYAGEKCCSGKPGLAVDSASGEVFMVWDYSLGTRFAIIGPGAASNQQLVPDATISVNGNLDTTKLDDQPISSRLGAPGVFIAYSGYCGGAANCASLNVWKAGSTAVPIVVDKQPDRRGTRPGRISIARGPEGRLWVMWRVWDTLFVSRSNKSATLFGKPIAVGDLPGWRAVQGTRGDGDLGPLDLFQYVNITNENQGYWHTRIFPELTVAASPKQIPAAGGSVTITVTDVGDPVAGAAISIGGVTLNTDAQGRATYTAPKRATPAPISVKVTASGYTDAGLKL